MGAAGCLSGRYDRSHWSKGWIIEDCEVSNSKCCGISLGKYYDPENDHYFTRKHVKSPTQMERDAVCRGQYHGWTKGEHRKPYHPRCHIHHCEQTGIVGRMGGVFSIIEDNHIHNINNMQQLGGPDFRYQDACSDRCCDEEITFIIVRWASGATGRHRERA